MQVTLTNLGPAPVPVVTNEAPEGGHVPVIDPGEALDIDGPTVVSVGDNPTIFEEFKEALAGMAAAVAAILGKLASWWADHQPEGTEAPVGLKVQIENEGANALRVLVDSNTNEYTVSPGATLVADATRYVELRELGV